MGVFLPKFMALMVCLLFLAATYIFIYRLTLTIWMFAASRTSSHIAEPSPALWNSDNTSIFLPGVQNRIYRQEVYSRAAHHHARHLHTPKKYHSHHRKIPVPINHSFRRVCYYTIPTDEWPSPKASQLDPDLCTHIIVGFAKVSEKTLQPFHLQDEAVFRDIIDLKEVNPELQVMLSIGGANNDKGFKEILPTMKDREEFAVNSARYLRDIGFDGLDVDWEFPAWYSPFEERFQFQLLLQELHYIYKNPIYNLTISVAVAASKSIIDRSYRVAQMAKYVDFVNMMGYDFHSFKWYLPLTGHNSPLYQRTEEWYIFSTVNLNFTAFYWIQLGMPREKLVIGLPTYGQSYQLYNPNSHGVYATAIGAGPVGTGGQVSYPTICEFLANGATREFDPESRVPYAYHKRTWISYDDEQSLKEKAQWIRKNQFGGAMIFDLNCDDYDRVCGNVTFPLIKAVLQGLESDE